MVKRLRIGIVGCGAIGSSLAKAIVEDFSQRATLTALYDIDPEKAEKLSRTLSKNKKLAVKGLAQLIHKSDLVIESASAKSSLEIAKDALSKGRSIMTMSVGGIVGHLGELFNLANKHQTKVYLPSGAICGIDGVKAANLSKIKKVILTTRKNPIAFKEIDYIKKKKIDLDRLKKDTLLFSGSAKEAVRHFPQNINVAAILSIAGIGENKTEVRIIAAPKIRRNIHEIEIESNAGRIFTRTENVLHPDNPKTSYLAVLSAQATLRQILGPIKAGT